MVKNGKLYAPLATKVGWGGVGWEPVYAYVECVKYLTKVTIV